jgi:putative DNA primase/helicase
MSFEGDTNSHGPFVSAKDAAAHYARRGWSVIPVPDRSKNPGFHGWQRLRLTETDLEEHFQDQRQNIGVLLGEPSGWLIDVDLDHPLAVSLAADFLPPTSAVFGRTGKPRSHWLYRVTAPLATKKFRSKSAGMLVEVRSTGMQTVIPPSTHESGELIEWEGEDAEPTEIDPQHLLEAAKRLADAVLVELGEKPATARSRAKSKPSPCATPPAPASPSVATEHRATLCLAAMQRMSMVDQNDGSSRLYAAACRVVEHDLNDLQGLAVIRQYTRERPFPTDWTDQQILQRFRDAERVCQRGVALMAIKDEQGYIALGTIDPTTGKLVLSPRRTLPTAEAFIRQFYTHREGRTLHDYTGVLLRWSGTRYLEIEDAAVKKHLQGWLHDALRYRVNPLTGEMDLVPFESNPATVKAALESIKAFVHLPASITPPAWIGRPDEPPPEEFLPCRSVLLHLPTMQRRPATPALLVTNALDFDPDPAARTPRAWFAFLHQLFDGDVQSLDLLQEWLGYCLTADTSQQKMLLIVGPRRSGKGTIARVAARLVGRSNVCGPTTSSLAGNFGLQPLIGKSLAIVSDARFSGENISTVVERLLCISGEDAVTVDRKYLPSVTLKLPTRFMFLTNELPRLGDVSGALVGRFVVLHLTESFYGREDTRLTEKLLAELPGILNWAIEGWQRLRERGRFVMPQSSADAVTDLEDLSSPVAAFVRDACSVGPENRVDVDELYSAWQGWCETQGRKVVATKQVVGRDLIAAVPTVKRRRGTGQRAFYEGIALKLSW